MSSRSFTDFAEHKYEFRKKWTRLRLIGSMRSVYEFWIPIVKSDGGQTMIRTLCLDWDSATHLMTEEICPYRRAGLEGRPVYYSNAIIRRLQNSEGEGSRDGLRDSPVRVIKIPPRLHHMLQNLAGLNCRINKSGKRKTYDLAHPKHGRDIKIKINPSEPYSYYDLQPRERTPLSREEQQYALWPLILKPETLAEAKNRGTN